MAGLLTISANLAAADEPIREFGPSDVAKGYVVAVDETTNSFDLRTSAGVVRARNPEWLVHLDRQGAPLPEMTLSKLKERHYYVTVMTEGTAPKGGCRFLIIVEALP
jgi:hypothetical protein